MKARKIILIAAILVIILTAVVIAGISIYFGKSLPAYSSTLTAAGLQSEVKIVRDDYGIPHIYADSMQDAFFAQGYCQAQDRLWEMDLSRRAVSGQLSEVFGESMLTADKFFLTL
ncbi:MAG: penicillin acylase family protein, partial [Desulfocucumaceae bacterium]